MKTTITEDYEEIQLLQLTSYDHETCTNNGFTRNQSKYLI